MYDQGWPNCRQQTSHAMGVATAKLAASVITIALASMSFGRAVASPRDGQETSAHGAGSGDARPSVLVALERGLHDNNASVRLLAVASLDKRHDSASFRLLEARLPVETDSRVKNAIERTLPAKPSDAELKRAKVVVRVDPPTSTQSAHPQSSSGSFQEFFQRIREQLSRVPGVLVIPSANPSWLQQGPVKKLPMFDMLTSPVTFSHRSQSGELRVKATVKFALAKKSTIKAVVEGTASSIGSSTTMSAAAVRSLETMALDGALTSAIRRISTTLAQAK